MQALGQEHPHIYKGPTSTGTVVPHFIACSPFRPLALTPCCCVACVQVACLHSYAAVHHLSFLTQLQHLSIGGKWYNNSRYRNNSSILRPVLPPQLLPAMSGLRSLESNLYSVGTLTGLSCCANLQHLKVCLNADSTKLGPDDWAGLAGLTALTQLCLLNVELLDATPEACTALSKLTRLQIAAAFKWSQAFLPALTACVQLTEVFGRWQWLDSSERAAVTLQRLLVLNTPGVTEGPPARYECFPNLRCLRQDVEVDSTPCLPDAAMHPSDLWSLCQHCTSLRELLLPADYYSLEPETNGLSCVAAIQSLTSLRLLTRLDFTPASGHELMALVQACCVLEGHSLQELRITNHGGLRKLHERGRLATLGRISVAAEAAFVVDGSRRMPRRGRRRACVPRCAVLLRLFGSSEPG